MNRKEIIHKLARLAAVGDEQLRQEYREGDVVERDRYVGIFSDGSLRSMRTYKIRLPYPNNDGERVGYKYGWRRVALYDMEKREWVE